MDPQDRIRELTEPMLQKWLYVVFSDRIKPLEAMGPLVPEHLEYLIDLEQRGILFASGPFPAEDGVEPGSGMIVLRAASLEEAVMLADEDPLHKSGVREYRVKAWQLMEGSFSLRVNFSDGTYALE